MEQQIPSKEKEYVITSDSNGNYYVVAADDFKAFVDFLEKGEEEEDFNVFDTDIEFQPIGEDPSFLKFTGYRID